MRWALPLLFALLAAPVAAAAYPVHDFWLQPEGKLRMAPPAEGSIPANCGIEGPSWRFTEVEWGPDFEVVSLGVRTRLEMALDHASLTWVFEAPATAAGLAEGLEVELGSTKHASGSAPAFVVRPGRNEVVVDLEHADVLPRGSTLDLHVMLRHPAACAGGADGPSALLGPVGSVLALGAAEHLELQAVPVPTDDQMRFFLFGRSSWGGYEPGVIDFTVALQGLSDTSGAKLEVERDSALWSWDLAGAAPGAYEGQAIAFLLRGHGPPLDAAVPVAFRVDEAGVAEAGPLGTESAASAPAAPLLALLVGLAVAARYRSASRSATALRTSLPW